MSKHISESLPIENSPTALSKPKNQELYVVGIGASAGGLEPLQQFFRAVEPYPHIAYVVIQHLSPDHKSMMDQLLGRETDLPVQVAKNRMQVVGGNVYVLPPGKTMTIKNGRLNLRKKITNKGLVFPVDMFFESLAKEMKEKAIGIILSGSGSDGTQGVRAIKEAEGTVLVQSLDSVRFDGMPKNAISTGGTDMELVPAHMPRKIFAITGDEYEGITTSISESSIHIADILVEILKLVKTHTGMDFQYYKHDMLLRRIRRRMQINQMIDLKSYLTFLIENPQEPLALHRDFLVGVTQFFRGTEAFEMIRDKVIPELIEKSENDHLRIWVPGCSTGEEAYSLAILIKDYLERNNLHIMVKIFATDVLQESIQFASKAIYPESIIKDVPDEFLSKYFSRQDDNFQIVKSVREMIVFTQHNLIQDAPFNRLSFISCRNVLLYFQNKIQNKLYAVFNFALNESGVLFLGSSESLEAYKEIFIPISHKMRIYRSAFRPTKPKTNMYFAPTNHFGIEQREKKTENRPALTPKLTYRAQLLEACNELLVEEYSTTCLFIDEKFELLRYFGNADRYLQVPQQPGSWNLLRMVNANMAAAISAGARKVLDTGKKLVYRQVRFEVLEKENFCTLILKKYKSKFFERPIVMIMIEENESLEPSQLEAEFPALNSSLINRIKELEHELNLSRESHQATIEELQASNEELMAANEELQGINEELQSVNEELYTINSEHQATIDALSSLNDDMDNLLRHTHIGILFLDSGLNIRRFNNAITTEIHVAETDIGRPVKHFSTQFPGLNLEEEAQSVVKNHQIIQKEILSNNGKWFVLRLLPYQVEEARPTGVLLTLIDITDIKGTDKVKELSSIIQLQQAELKKSVKNQVAREELIKDIKEETRAIRNGLPDYYCKVGRGGKCIETNINIEHAPQFISGKSSGKIEQLSDFLSPSNSVVILEGIFKSLEEENTQEVELSMQVNNQNYYYLVYIVPVDSDLVMLVFRNISEQKNLMQALMHNQELTQLMGKNIPEARAILLDQRLECIFTEGKISSFCDEGQNLQEVLEETNPLLQNCKQILQGKSLKEISWKYDGDDFVVNMFAINYGNPSCLIILQKITDSKLRERSLKGRIEDLEQFAHSVSHDLKSPLRSIAGFAQLLKKKYAKNLDSQAIEYIDYIVGNTKGMGDLIHGLLTYALLGAEESDSEPVDTTHVIEEITGKLEGVIHEKKVKISYSDLPMVLGNHSHLTQLFQNLIENGIKFNTKAKKTIHVSSKISGSWATFCVKDNGIGIPDEYREQIFTIFKHLNTRDRFEGSGIGLSVCKRIVERLGGTIWVKSELEKGSMFFFTLPLMKEIVPM